MNYRNCYVNTKRLKYDFSLSHNPFGCSDNVIDAVKNNVDKLSFYPSSEKTLIKKISEINDISINNIAITCGSINALDIAIDVCLQNSSDEIILPVLSFEEAAFSAQRKTKKIIYSKMKDNFEIDLENIKSLITKNTKIIFIVNPNNPTGLTIKTKELIELSTLIPNGYLIIDEASIEFNPDCESSINYIKFFKNIITLRTFSKAYGLPGARIGYICTHTELIDKINSNYPPHRCSELSLLSGIEALSDQKFVNESVKKIIVERNKIIQILDEYNIEYIPSTIHTILIKTPPIFKNFNKFERFLNDRDISFVSFKEHDLIRIAIQKPEINDKLISAIKEISL